MHKIPYRRKISPKAFFREWMLTRELRNRPVEFDRSRPVISIIGDYISDRIRAEGVYERDFLELLRDRVFDWETCAGQTAADVGANIGNHSLFLSDIFKRVIAFEPNPLASSILELNLNLNDITNVEVRRVGLGDEAGRTRLSFHPSNLGAASSSKHAAIPTSRQCEIDLVVGDDELRESESIGFIKIDVEGAEEAVLKGLKRTIGAHKPIVMMEQWAAVIDAESGTSPAFTLLSDLGYQAWEIIVPPQFLGRMGNLRTMLLRYTESHLAPVERLEKRDYSALIFTPPSYEFPSHK